MRIKVYTYSSAGYDDLIKDGRDYVEIPETLVTRSQSSRMIARLAKCLPHLLFDAQKYDACLWIDSNVTFKEGYDFKKLYFEYFENVKHCGLFFHTERSSINEEIEAVNRLGIDYPSLSVLHKNRIGRLAWTGILYRRFTPEVIAANNRWWAEISTKSSRDQLSFPYCFEGLIEYMETPDIEKGKKCWKNNSKWLVSKHLKPATI